MDTTATKQRGIPRFSKLPQPGRIAAAPEPRPVTPVEASAKPIGRPVVPRSIRAPAAQAPVTQAPPSATRPNTRPVSSYGRPPSSYGGIRAPSQLGQNSLATPRRQPLAPARPQSKQGLYQPRDNALNLDTYNVARSSRTSSQEENDLRYESNSPHSDSWSSPSTPYETPISPSKTTRKARPSLSDRTIESLSHTPTASARRNSNFFTGPGQPAPTATPSRSAAVAPPNTTARKLSYGASRSAMPRPMSPTKRPTSSYGAIPAPSSVTRRMSTVAPRTGGMSSYAQQATSPTKTTGRSVAATPHVRAKSIAEPRSAMPTPRSTRPLRAPTASADLTKSRMAPAKPLQSLTRSTSTRQPQSTGEEGPALNSTTAFRDQIAKAKAERRAAITKSVSISAGASASAYTFDNVVDPFGQSRDDGKGELRKRLDAARRDGRLNIAAMNTKSIPPEVMQMYDAEAVQAGSVPWNECVDLVRLLAGDNDIETIGDDIFPDIAIETLQEEGGTNQFGGLETLDLRGNLLVNIPMGLRRLECLTSLNLSRNKLENWSLDIIAQIPSLRELNLSDNALSLELPSSIGSLTELESLDVHGNKLSSLPKSIRHLKTLRSLNVGNNRISDLNMDILTLLPLTELYASSNALTGALFPMNVSQMPRLQVLSIANNSIASLSFSPTLSFPSLRRLDVSCNRLFMLPDVSSWQCLNNLLCEENSLEAFPSGFTSLSSLRNASFEHNNIHDLVDGIQDMDSLQTLALGGNSIRPTKYMTMSTDQLKIDLAKKYTPMEDVTAADPAQRAAEHPADEPHGDALDNSGIGETF